MRASSPREVCSGSRADDRGAARSKERPTSNGIDLEWTILPPVDEGPVMIGRSSRKGTSLETGGYRAVSNFRRRHQMAYTSEVGRSTDHRNPPQASAVTPAEDVRTIALNQISWGAVFAGATIALVVQLILNMVGVGVGLSTIDIAAGNTPSAELLSIGAGIWWVISGSLPLRSVATLPGGSQESRQNPPPPIMG